MAITKLGLYNDALIKVGEDVLDDLAENRDSRITLDAIYDLGAIDYCLEVVRPKFASSTTQLSGAATTGGVTLAFTHTLPADFVTVVGVYSDSELDQEVSRYIIEGSSLLCDYDTIFLRYTNNTVTEANFSPGFARVVSYYLARESCYKFDPDRQESLDASLQAQVELVIKTEGEKEPEFRPAAEGSTLSTALRKIYNDALLILGVPKLPSGSADTPARVALDTALESGAVEDVLEDTEWLFGIASVKIEYDPSVDPDWGYSRAHQKPLDLLRISGLFIDEFFRTPLRDYVDEGNYFFSEHETIYLKYIPTTYLTQYDAWPTYFARLVAARLAMNAAPVINKEMILNANAIYDRRKDSATSNDAIQSPPQIIHTGNWVQSRYAYGTDRDRP